MKKEEAIKHLQWRLSLLNHGYRITWSLKDRTAVSELCIQTTEHTALADGLHACACGELITTDEYRCQNCRDMDIAYDLPYRSVAK